MSLCRVCVIALFGTLLPSLAHSAAWQPAYDLRVLADIKKPGGMLYTNNTSTQFLDDTVAMDRACLPPGEKPTPPRPFSIIVTLDVDGRAVDTSASATGTMEDCYVKHMRKQYTAPRFAPFHLQFFLFVPSQ